MWFYIYDEDIPPARVYSPSLKSPDNAPEGCSSLQAEIFYANGTEIPPAEKVLEETVSKLKGMGLFNDDDIVVKDIRFEPYANIIFDHNIYSCRKIVLDYLAEKISSQSDVSANGNIFGPFRLLLMENRLQRR